MRKVLLVCLVSVLIASVGVLSLGAEKFRAVPLTWILDLQQKLAKPWTPSGPNGEPVMSAANLQLTAAEKQAARALSLKEYYYMGATLDQTEILNKVGMNEALAEVGKSPIPFMGANSISEQIDQIKSLEAHASQVSFIVAEAYEAVTTGPAFTALANAGVPQLHNWTTPKGLYGSKNYIGLIDADGYGQGAAAAEILAYAMNYHGEVGIIYFALKQWTNVMRLKGAEDTFAKYPNIKIVAKQGFTDPAQCEKIATGMLQAHPEIDAIWATWMMGPATGAAEAIRALGETGKVVVAAPDLGGITGARYIADKNYPIIGGVGADCIQMGKNSIHAALKWLLGEKTKMHNIYVVSRVYPIVRANIVDGFYRQTHGALGFLPPEVLELAAK